MYAEKRSKDADTGHTIARRAPRRRRDGAPPPSRAHRCTSTYACKKFAENGACAEAADAVLAQCKCRRTLTTKFGEVCVERCCAPRRKKGGKDGTHLMGWLHRKKHRPGYRSARAVYDK